MIIDFLYDYVMPIAIIILVILFIVTMIFAIRENLIKEDYLYNKANYIIELEQKVNTYEQEYDNFVLEDSERQIKEEEQKNGI